MAYDDLRDWIKALDRAGELKRVRTEADPILEIAEIADRVSKSRVLDRDKDKDRDKPVALADAKEVLVDEKPRETTVEFLASLAGVLVTGLFIITFILQAFEIPSGSMEENLLIGDHILVNKFIYGPAASSFDGSQALPILRASWFTGMLAKSPLMGVTMRQRQSSLITDTQ